jgi:hypothetical protein
MKHYSAESQLRNTDLQRTNAYMQAAGPGPATTNTSGSSSCFEPQLTFKQWQQVLLRIAQQHFPSLQPEEGLERLVGSRGEELGAARGVTEAA